MPQINQHEIDAKIDAILNRWPAVGLAVGVVRGGALGSPVTASRTPGRLDQ